MAKLFEPFRAVGFVTDDAPCVVQKKGSENFITASIGKGYHIYNCARLNLVFISTAVLPRRVRAMAAIGDFTLTACGAEIVVWSRGKMIRTLEGHTANVSHLLAFGAHLVSLSMNEELKVWDVKTGECIAEIALNRGSTPTCIMHPSTYLNKVVIGYKDGGIEIWNLNSCKRVHAFDGWGSSVTAMVQSTAVDVIGIGLANGRILVHDIKYDESVVTFTQTSGAITGMSFRTDGVPTLATGCSSGVVHVWDLERRRLGATLAHAHDDCVRTVQFLTNEPVLVTSGADNSIKMWIFDLADGTARLLRSRCGHSAPPSKIRYYGNGQQLLSCGTDRSFRRFSTIQEHQSRELSQGSIVQKAKKRKATESEIKLPPVVDFAFAELRERDWCNVVTCHAHHHAVYTWSYQDSVIGKHVLRAPGVGPDSHDAPFATAVDMSTCGNFAFVGYDNGSIIQFNVQSGLVRGTYDEVSRHKGAVTGLAVNMLGSELMSAGFDGQLKTWDTAKRSLVHTVEVASPITSILLNREINLLVAASDDLTLRLFDTFNRRLVREFTGHTNRITDVTFSPDGRWLLSSSTDLTVQVFDLPTGRRIDWIKFDKAVTSLSFSPQGEFLATSHTGSVALYLWASKSLYAPVFLSESHEPVPVALPASATTTVANDGDGGDGSVNEAVGALGVYESSTDQLAPGLVTLSTLPRPVWLALPYLDIIRERNKPAEPAKAPEAAPFFLPTLPGVDPVFAPVAGVVGDGEGEEANASRILNLDRHDLHEATPFLKLLRDARDDEQDYTVAMSHFKKLTASAMDVEIRLLSDAGEGDDLRLFLQFIHSRVESRCDFELVQSALNLFLKVHGEALTQASPSVVDELVKVEALHSSVWSALQDQFDESMCLIKYFGNLQA